MLEIDFLAENHSFPLSFTPTTELRGFYRFLRLLKKIDLPTELFPFSFDFILETQIREYPFPRTFSEFERIIHDQGTTAQSLWIFKEINLKGTTWACYVDLKENKLVFKGTPTTIDKIIPLWHAAYTSYGVPRKK